MVAALVRARVRDEYDTPAMRAAVAGLSSHARMGGLPPERLLIVLKDSVASPQLLGSTSWWRATVIDRLVRWGIEGYYGQ